MDDRRQTAIGEQFDRASKRYLSKHVRPETLREQQRLFDLAANRRRFSRALDLGCGPGTMSEAMLVLSDEVWGVDRSPGMIQIAIDNANSAQQTDQVHFEVGSAETLRFPDKHFDLVFCVGVLRYLDKWEKGLAEIHRVLKPNGVLVVTFYYRFSIQWFYMCLSTPLLSLATLVKRRSLAAYRKKYRTEPLPFSYRTFKRVFSETGFTGMQCQHSGFEIYPLRRLFPNLSRSIYLKLESLWFNSNTLGWLGSICVVKGIKQE
jgi:demethylmenaquinone methyltransferase/2-methoxy-6-polyprenyl-1,4-benzoquinol methylase